MISCDESAIFYSPVMWVFELVKLAYGIDIIGDRSIIVDIGDEEKNQIVLSNTFYQDLLINKKYEFDHYFEKSPLITTELGRPDYISTIFYMVNGFQEYNLPEFRKDKFGRLDYTKSYQNKFDILEKDLVKTYVKKLLFQIDKSIRLPELKSKIFISHDIDSVYGSLKYDGLYALKNGHLGEMMNVIWQTVFLNPPWFNIDKVANLNNEYNVKACYYWIVENGRSIEGIKNGDYTIKNKKIQAQLQYVQSFRNEVGLHKSTMDIDFGKEMSNLPSVKSNRFHFLKISNPKSFIEMERHGIQSDSSIGFPYHMGFKNNFGMPFYPYDIERNRKINVLEIPLQIMDGMFNIIDAKSKEVAYGRIVDFIEANMTDSIISILWHNSELTNFTYKWSFDCYEKLLRYFIENKFETVLPSQLVEAYEAV